MVGGPGRGDDGVAWPAGFCSDDIDCAVVDFGPSAVQKLGVGCGGNSVPLNIRPLFLSPRQNKCLALVASGCTEREVALRLGIATATVRGHLARARERMGARSTCQAAVLAVRAGLLDTPDTVGVRGVEVTGG
jgi:DNA-binding CsgD family transcriptional regulator